MADIECICPPKRDGTPRHPGGDTITLRERLDFRGALTARNALAVAKAEDDGVDTAEILAILTEQYLLQGIESWTLVDDKGKPIEVSRAAIREHLLSRPDAAMVVGDEADGRYSASVLTPLVARASTSSPPTPTTGSTSAKKASSTPRQKPSKPSSITPFPTGDTETMSASRGGGSSSSQS